MPTNSTDFHTLELRGELTIRTIADVQQTLASAYAATRVLRVDLTEATDVDLALVQLLIAARRSASHDGKAISLAQPLPDALTNVLSRGGFSAMQDSAFWTTNG